MCAFKGGTGEASLAATQRMAYGGARAAASRCAGASWRGREEAPEVEGLGLATAAHSRRRA
jgi:hypothetical protein